MPRAKNARRLVINGRAFPKRAHVSPTFADGRAATQRSYWSTPSPLAVNYSFGGDNVAIVPGRFKK
jgi:hypothetical protein